jgi:aspartate 1-decarboxylase
MLRSLVKSKIQRLTITDKNLVYEGSLGVDKTLMKAADIVPNETVQVVNVNNGARFETYAIEYPAGSGSCVLNGAAARLGEVGDKIIVMTTALFTEDEIRRHRLVKVDVDDRNSIKKSDRNSPRGG